MIRDSKGLMEQNEPHVLPLLQNEDPGAIAAMLDAHGDRLLRAAFLFCRDRNEAQDLVQETFCRAIPALKKFRGECLLYTWLYGILRNLCIRHLRKQRHFNFFSAPPRTESAAPGPACLAETAERSTRLAETLDGMPAKQREILLLRFGEEMKIREIAELLAISPGTVKSRLHEALKRVRIQITPDWEPVPGREETHEM
jgi:RNA polymerase sigma-70 factor, ECF subfamily